mmetsp:Transcript_617/g.1472  ORF Transcript_617/g.1472 Transcript_617/m.1472 type:complete len:205 (+) Transcript_617:801-1415(+)
MVYCVQLFLIFYFDHLNITFCRWTIIAGRCRLCLLCRFLFIVGVIHRSLPSRIRVDAVVVVINNQYYIVIVIFNNHLRRCFQCGCRFIAAALSSWTRGFGVFFLSRWRYSTDCKRKVGYLVAFPDIFVRNSYLYAQILRIVVNLQNSSVLDSPARQFRNLFGKIHLELIFVRSIPLFPNKISLEHQCGLFEAQSALDDTFQKFL